MILVYCISLFFKFCLFSRIYGINHVFYTLDINFFQVCLYTALTVSKCNQLNVVYIDTNGAFDIGRVQDLLESMVETEEVK